MRQIKFRCWDKRNNLYTQYSTDFIKVYDFAVTGASYIDLEQWTGGYDKNGTEIYEGDIVKIEDLHAYQDERVVDIAEVCFMHYCWILKFIDSVTSINPDLFNEYADTDYYELEVIGNKHMKNIKL